jgi:hypothetical protein
MNNKILFAILTCNRFYYFKNCIESIIKCVDMDRIDILIVDNNTVESGFDEYVHSLCLKHDNIKVKKFTDRTRGELYRAMNWAVTYAKKNCYDIVDFIQDDIQYLYNIPSHLDDIVEIFNKHNNIVQINCNLAWRRKIDKIGKVDNIEVNGHKYGILHDKRCCDSGFTRVNVYDQIGAYPMDAISWGMEKNRYVGKVNGEIWFGKKCYKRGFKRALAYNANSGMIFDCAYVRGDERYGNYFPSHGEFYFKMLGKEYIKKINKRTKKNKFSYMEDFCIPDGWTPKTYGKHGDISIRKKINE